jgi:hypothetical protein
VIEEDVGTAIILEDDIDWDVNIHDIFQELSIQMRKGELRKQRATSEEIEGAPYGKNVLRTSGSMTYVLRQHQFVLRIIYRIGLGPPLYRLLLGYSQCGQPTKTPDLRRPICAEFERVRTMFNSFYLLLENIPLHSSALFIFTGILFCQFILDLIIYLLTSRLLE